MPTRRFDAILFDADETLFDFDARAGLARLLAAHRVEFSAQDYSDFEAVNVPLWVQFHAGQISATDLQVRRFSSWSQRLGVPAQQLNDGFLDAMADVCKPLPGARELLLALRVLPLKLALITNGFTRLQRLRLQRTGLAQVFDCVAISEELGVAKPHRAIFDHTLRQLGSNDRSRVLMVGDRLETDILGGRDAGLQTCWLRNPATPHTGTVEGVQPDCVVDSLEALRDWLWSSGIDEAGARPAGDFSEAS
jgi:5'-nucleotidase